MIGRVKDSNTQGGPGHGRQLGRALRELRNGADLTQTEVGTRIGCRQAKINKIESSLSGVGSDDLEKLIDLYQVPAERAAELRDLAKARPARRSSDAPVIWPANDYLTDRELDARTIFAWYSEGIPVPLCSEPYMLRRLSNHPGSRQCVTELLAKREARAKLFSGESTVDYQPILSESALRRMPGGNSPQLLVEQMEYMANLTRRSNPPTLRILPFDAPLDFVDSNFVLVRFPPGSDEKDFAYIEYASGARNIFKASELKTFEEHWRRTRDAALRPVDSIALIESIANKTRDSLGIMREHT